MTEKILQTFPIGVDHCVLPDIAQTPVLAPLPQFRRFPWDPLPRNPM